MLLDKIIAKRFLDDPSEENHFLLAESREITDDAAELLATRSGGELPLLRLKFLSPASADSFAAFSGELFLDGLVEPPAAILAKLAARVTAAKPPSVEPSEKTHGKLATKWQRRSKFISLKGMQSITQEQAEALAGFEGKLGLCGLLEISEDCAKLLGHGSCHHLYLDGLRTITSKALKALLGRHSIVSLNGLESLPSIDDSWEELEDSIVELYLDGLKSASYEALKTISRVPSDFLYLNGLESLPQQDEELFENCGAQLFLNGLRKLTDLDLRIFGTNRPKQPLVLDGLEELDARQAEMLVGTDRGTFSLGLRAMSDEVASVLLRSQSYCFIMDRLEELTPFAAEVCGRHIHAESVHFNGIQQISDEAFELLLADYTGHEIEWCPGSIDLNGLKHLTPRMRKALAETKHEVSLLGITGKESL